MEASCGTLGYIAPEARRRVFGQSFRVWVGKCKDESWRDLSWLRWLFSRLFHVVMEPWNPCGLLQWAMLMLYQWCTAGVEQDLQLQMWFATWQHGSIRGCIQLIPYEDQLSSLAFFSCWRFWKLPRGKQVPIILDYVRVSCCLPSALKIATNGYPLFFVSRLSVTKGVGENHSNSVAVTMIQGDSSRQVNFDQLPYQSCFLQATMIVLLYHLDLVRSFLFSWIRWSVGVIVYILLSGCMPFAGSEQHQIVCIMSGMYDMEDEVGFFHFVVIGDFEVWCASLCDEGSPKNQRLGSSARSGKAFQAVPRTLCLDRSQMVDSHHVSWPSSSSLSSTKRASAPGFLYPTSVGYKREQWKSHHLDHQTGNPFSEDVPKIISESKKTTRQNSQQLCGF